MPTKQRAENEVSIDGRLIDETTLRLVLEARARYRGTSITTPDGAFEGHLYHTTIDGSQVSVQIRRNYIRAEAARSDLDLSMSQRAGLMKQRESVADAFNAQGNPELKDRLVWIDLQIEELEQRMADLEATAASVVIETHTFPLTGDLGDLLSGGC